MAKIAVFVEGYTELQLLIKLLPAICGHHNVRIAIYKQLHGLLHAVSLTGPTGASSFIMLADCATDGQVATQIRDRYAMLVAQGYTAVFGLRDVYPMKQTDVASLQAGLRRSTPTGTVPVEIHLAILETEAWFLDEWTHFERIDPALDETTRIAAGFDLRANPGVNWPHPAGTLSAIYKIAKKTYLTAQGRRKRAFHIDRTVSALDAEELYMNASSRSPSFRSFLTSLENALF